MITIQFQHIKDYKPFKIVQSELQPQVGDSWVDVVDGQCFSLKVIERQIYFMHDGSATLSLYMDTSREEDAEKFKLACKAATEPKEATV